MATKDSTNMRALRPSPEGDRIYHASGEGRCLNCGDPRERGSWFCSYSCAAQPVAIAKAEGASHA